MIAFLAAALVFVLMGAVLIRRACRSWMRGLAVTDEDDLIHKRTQPLQFSLFIAVQIVFGCVLVLGGVFFFCASFFTR